MNEHIIEQYKKIEAPVPMGSYASSDCIFLLKSLNGIVEEQDNLTRERAMQSGTHYCEMLPIEYMPKPSYMEVYEKALKESASQLAYYIGVVSELILKERGKDVILASLARGGTPIGVLIKRYIEEKYKLQVPHYSISVLRDLGIDENALVYIIGKHGHHNVQFIDGWTGKGAILNTLVESCNKFSIKYHMNINPSLAVVCDPGECVELYGTREDFLIPSACLNATVAGLLSRTCLRSDWVLANEFHGAKYYKEWESIDVSNTFINTIVQHYKDVQIKEKDLIRDTHGIYKGFEVVEDIRRTFKIDNVHRIKPGVGETTRVLLRRMPWKVLVKDRNNPNLKHILMLAKSRGVEVEIFDKMPYACCGLIRAIDHD